MRPTLEAVLARVSGSDRAGDLRLRRTLLFMLAAFSSIAGIVWGSLYVVLGEWQAALFPYAYSVLSAPSLFLGRSVRHLDDLIRFQLVLIMATPFLLSVALGGFVGSSAVVLWALLGPIGAFLISGRRRAVRWLLVYLILIAITAVAAPEVTITNELPGGVVIAFFVLNVGSVSTIAFGLLYYFVGENQRVLELLKLEKSKSERLLLNILPREVADALRGDETTIADHHEEVSVLFADIVGFTPMSESMEATAVVDLLNTVFSHFDGLVEHYAVEKVRTIGDNYMVVAGAPRQRPNHGEVMAEMALDMMAFLDDFSLPNGDRLQFRIGINSGSAVAGVIGTAKFQYDVWGESVNLASRMESHGVPGRIQIAPATYEIIRHEFDCRPRGPIEIKGVGVVETWFLVGRIEAQV